MADSDFEPATSSTGYQAIDTTKLDAIVEQLAEMGLSPMELLGYATMVDAREAMAAEPDEDHGTLKEFLLEEWPELSMEMGNEIYLYAVDWADAANG